MVDNNSGPSDRLIYFENVYTTSEVQCINVYSSINECMWSWCSKKESAQVSTALWAKIPNFSLVHAFSEFFI